jgi:hypothetical protein
VVSQPANEIEVTRSGPVLHIRLVLVQFKLTLAQPSKIPILLRCQHCVPDSGRASIFEA